MWSNRVNESNHYSCDVIVRKIMEEDKKLTLQETVNKANWTYNTNVNVLRFSPMQLVTGKNVVFPGLVNGNEATGSLFDDEIVWKIMEMHYSMMKEFRELEFSNELRKASNTRVRGYERVKVKENDLVYYQNKTRRLGWGL